MSDSTPIAPPPPPPPPPSNPTAATGGGKGKKVAAAGAGVVLLAAVVGGGAYAYNQLSGGGAQPEDVLPATTQVYARVDLDPGASQKIALFKLLNKVPEVGKAIGIEDADKSDVRKLIFDEVNNACPDIDYDKDVEPWLGDRVGVGANVDDEQFIIAVQVKDEDKAKDGVAELFECAGEDYGIAFDQGYALISESQKSVDDALDGAKKGTLADNKDFIADMDELGEKGIATAWVDAEGLLGSLGDLPGFGDALTEEQKKQIEDAGSAAMALRVDGSAIELAGVAQAVDSLDVDAAPIGDLPEDTVAAVSLSGLGEQIGDQWDVFLNELNSTFNDFSGSSSGPPQEFLDQLDPDEREYYEELYGSSTGGGASPEDFIKQFETETGLSLPDDLESLLGSTFTLAVGGNNLETIPTLSGPSDLEKLEIAIRTTDGKGKAIDVMTKLADYAAKNNIPLVAQETDGGAVLSTSADAAKKFSGGGDLGDSKRFKSVMPFGDDTTQAFYLDVHTILDKLLAANPPEDLSEMFKQAQVIDAVGISAGNSGDHAKFSLRVNFSD